MYSMQSKLSTMVTNIGDIPVRFSSSNPNFLNWWSEFNPCVRELPKGWQRGPEWRALPESLIWEKDVAITLRDGVILRGDVFRAKRFEGQPLPAILPWSPYGKTGTGKF